MTSFEHRKAVADAIRNGRELPQDEAEQLEIRALALRVARERINPTGAALRASLEAERQLVMAALDLTEGRPISLKATRSERTAAAEPPTSPRSTVPETTDRPVGGYFTRYSQPTRITNLAEGDFVEVIRPGAFAQSIREDRASIRCLYAHGRDPQIGAKPLGPFAELREDTIGGLYAVRLSRTSYAADIRALVADRLLGSSMAFAVRGSGGERWSVRGGVPQREVIDAQLFECGPTPSPAYSGTPRSRHGTKVSQTQHPSPTATHGDTSSGATT